MDKITILGFFKFCDWAIKAIVHSKCHNVTFENLYEYEVYQGYCFWVCSVYVDINSRYIQLENLAFSVDSSPALLELIIFVGLVKFFVGLVRNLVGLVDLEMFFWPWPVLQDVLTVL